MAIRSCGNGCGLIAAFVGVLGFGLFGAPFKGVGEEENRKKTHYFLLLLLLWFL
jgi:hypothetical protein